MAKILAVDDEPDMIWAITNVLLSEGHSVVSVNSGEEALVKVKDSPLDLVLLDFRLPGMDGIQILEKIKQIKPLLPVIMVTGYGGIEEAVQAIKLGASHYISKPFDNAQLIESVNKALQMDALRSEGLFGKRLAEKISPPKAERPSVQFQKKQSPGMKNILPLSVAAGLFALFFIGGLYFWNSKGGTDREFAIGHSKVSGLAFSGSSLWVTDWFTENIERYDWDGNKLNLVNSVSMPGAHLTGIAAAGDFLFTCDSWKKEISKYSSGERMTLAAAYPSPGPEPSGLFYDGKYLWSCDGKTRKVYRHALDDMLSVLEEYPVRAQFPVGMSHDGVRFWTADAVGAKIYRNLLQERFRQDAAFIFGDSPAGKPISAFSVKDGRFWVAYEGVSKIFLKNPSRLKETTP